MKVITAHEMARIESMSVTAGKSELQLMENAGRAIAQCALEFIEENECSKRVILLVGKGNNGGDAFAAGCHLLDHGIQVAACHLYPVDQCSPLCQTMYQRFLSKKGEIHYVKREETLHFEKCGLILDGLVGTGFRGKAEGMLAVAIKKANRSKVPILAIDIPSGVNGDTGAVENVAIHAAETIALGFPKAGFFFREGWDHLGNLKVVPIGLEKKECDEAKAAAYLLDEASLPSLLPPLKRTRHKYEAGYVLGIAGSPGMPGAALLSCSGAYRSGAGIVRLFHPYHMEAELSSAPYELIREEWNGKNLKRIREESKRAKALFIGPGISRTKEAKKMFRSVLSGIHLPMVIDADGLFFLAENPTWELPLDTILTPHHQEMERLLRSFSHAKKEKHSYFDLVQAFVDKKEVTLVLKGAPTWVFHPHAVPVIITHGDPGMATAGTGDVLTGIIAALRAQGLPPQEAAVLSVALHGIAGEIAAAHLTSYSMTSTDLLECLPEAFANIIAFRGCLQI